MITLTRIGGPADDFFLFTIARENEEPERILTRAAAARRLIELQVQNPDVLIDRAIEFGSVLIHEHEWGAAQTMSSPQPRCDRCDGTGWVCEAHTDRPWDGLRACGCGAPGSPCPDCNSENPPRMMPDFSEGWRH